MLREGRFYQRTSITCKLITDKVIQIEPKQDLNTRAGNSPDVADASASTVTHGAPEPRLRYGQEPLANGQDRYGRHVSLWWDMPAAPFAGTSGRAEASQGGPRETTESATRCRRHRVG